MIQNGLLEVPDIVGVHHAKSFLIRRKYNVRRQPIYDNFTPLQPYAVGELGMLKPDLSVEMANISPVAT